MKPQGFTLIEMLVSIAVFSILMLAFTQLFGSTLRASGEVNARNEVIYEGQVAQQLIASRLQNAYFVYGNGTTFQMTETVRTSNTIRGGQNWTVGTDPVVAMVLPPEDKTVLSPIPTPYTCTTALPQACFTFYAYYPILRSTLISDTDVAASEKPDPDPNNANQWLLMEYKAYIYDNVNRTNDQLASPPGAPYDANGNGAFTSILTNAANPTIKSRVGRILVDYVQPQAAIPAYAMFRVCNPRVSTLQPNCPTGTTATSPKSVALELRFLQRQTGRDIRAPTGNAPLSTRVYPRNWN